ncbi:hypothetical protein MHYP_G00002800 [Metynnis hypsauchen]
MVPSLPPSKGIINKHQFYNRNRSEKRAGFSLESHHSQDRDKCAHVFNTHQSSYIRPTDQRGILQGCFSLTKTCILKQSGMRPRHSDPQRRERKKDGPNSDIQPSDPVMGCQSSYRLRLEETIRGTLSDVVEPDLSSRPF